MVDALLLGHCRVRHPWRASRIREHLLQITLRIQLPPPRIFNEHSPVVSSNETLGVTENPQTALCSRQSNVHTPNVLQETDATCWRCSHAGEDDDFALTALVGIRGVELDGLKDGLSISAREAILEFAQLALVRCDDANLAFEVVV